MEQIRGRSDLCMYELEDIFWDEFDPTDHHIVPHQNGTELAFKGDSCKKRRREVIDIARKAADRSTVGEGFDSLKNIRETMLEKDSWSHTPEDVFPSDRDSNKEVASLASDSTRIPDQCFKSNTIDTISSGFCNDGSIMGERRGAVDSNSYCYSPSDISQTDNVLNFYDDTTSYLDVDRIFRNYDSMFGNEDELSWLSASNNIDGMLMPDFKFSFPESSMFRAKPEQHGEFSSINDSNFDSSCLIYKKHTFSASEDDEPNSLGDWTFVTGFNPVSGSNGEVTTKGEIIFHDLQAKHRNESEGKEIDQCLKKGGSFHNIGDMRSKDTKLPPGDLSCQVFTSPHVLKQDEKFEPDSLGYLQNSIPCMMSEYIHFSDQVPTTASSTGIRSETSALGSLSAKESSYASYPMSMEISHEYLFEAPSVTMDEKRENIPVNGGFQLSFSSNPNHVDLLVHTASCDPISHVHHFENEVGNQSNVKGVGIRMPADLDTSNVQETSCMSSEFDEISQEASTFHHLQQVMKQLQRIHGNRN